MNKIIESCQFLLENTFEAQSCRDYLNNRLSSNIQKAFQFGYFPNSNNFSQLTDLISEEELKDNNLLYSLNISDISSYRKMISIYFEDYPLVMPYHNQYGEIVGMVGRTLLNDKERTEKNIPKYKNTKETKSFKKGNLLFGLYQNKDSILEKDCVYIVEGQFDVIKSYEIGFTNIVALGNCHMTLYQLSVILRYTNNIFLLLDNDSAGLKGRQKIRSKFGQFANIVDKFVPEEYKDIDDYITNAKISNVNDLSFLDSI